MVKKQNGSWKQGGRNSGAMDMDCAILKYLNSTMPKWEEEKKKKNSLECAAIIGKTRKLATKTTIANNGCCLPVP